MDHYQRNRLVRRIIIGKLDTEADWQNTVYKLSFQDPTLEILYQSDVLYQNSYKKLLEDSSVMTLEQSHKQLIERGHWSVEQDQKIEKINKEIEILQERLPSLRFKKTAEKTVINSIEKGKAKLKELNDIKNQLFPYTAEFISERSKRHFIIRNITKINDCLLLNTNFAKNNSFLDFLSVYYYDEHSISTSQLRELSRTDPWRLYWTLSKDTGTSLFRTPATEITDYQYWLVYWSKVYDFAYESQDRPTEDVISDDEKFDAWYKWQSKKIDDELKKRSLDNSFPNNSGVGRQETFIIADKEGAKDVYDMNDQQSRAIIKERENFIKEKGEVKDQYLPDVQRDLRVLMNQAASSETINRSRKK